jgi:hypothetical protein
LIKGISKEKRKKKKEKRKKKKENRKREKLRKQPQFALNI